MDWISILWPMGISAMLTLALIHALVWLKNRRAYANLAFVALALSVSGLALCELLMLRADTSEEFGTALRWAHVPIFGVLASLVAFVLLYFRTGRLWLGALVLIVRFAALVLNFWLTPNINYRAITSLSTVPLLGVPVAVPNGIVSPWALLPQLSGWLLLVFVVDASIRLWRHGSRDARRRAVWLGGAMMACVVLGFGRGAAILLGVSVPFLVTFPFLGIVAVMGYELSLGIIREAQLARQLQESEDRLALASDAARLGFWSRDVTTDRIWVTDKWRVLFELQDGEVTYADFLRRVHPDDRGSRQEVMARAIEAKSLYSATYRVLLPRGGIRWIASQGRVECDADGKAKRLLGACLDITEQREAERAARELSGRLISAQEDERRRIARDLHDDFNQRLAVLAVRIDRLGQGARTDGDSGSDVAEIADSVRELSSDVHRLSHQLHPAKVHQLGLVTATKSWCRDLTRQAGVQIDVSAERVAPDLPPDTALCLFRIVQESLRNVLRHSGARAARVDLTGHADRVALVISDSGQGFDTSAARNGSGLGLLSMQERIRLLHGTFEIYSSLGEGTRVEASLPLVPLQAAAVARLRGETVEG